MQSACHRLLTLAIAFALAVPAACSASNATKPTEAAAATTPIDDKSPAAGAGANTTAATAPMVEFNPTAVAEYRLIGYEDIGDVHRYGYRDEFVRLVAEAHAVTGGTLPPVASASE